MLQESSQPSVAIGCQYMHQYLHTALFCFSEDFALQIKIKDHSCKCVEIPLSLSAAQPYSTSLGYRMRQSTITSVVFDWVKWNLTE